MERGFDLSEVCFPQVDGMGCVRVRTNLYSVPAKPGTTVEVRISPSLLEVRDEGRPIARHERSYDHQRQSWNSNIIWTYWSESLAHWRDRNRSPPGEKKDSGLQAMTICLPR